MHASIARFGGRWPETWVKRNVVDLAEVPVGRVGRASKSLTPEQVDAVLTQTAPDRMHNYIVVVAIDRGRTEELRALRWEHVHMEGNPDRVPPVPPYLEVWRSVRAGGDTKTRRSRRTLALPARCVESLRNQRARQAADRLAAGDRWQDSGMVFTTALGTEMDAGNVRRASEVRSHWSPASTRRSGRRVSCGTRSSRCCPMPGCRWRRSRGWLVTAAPPSRSWCTGTSSSR